VKNRLKINLKNTFGLSLSLLKVPQSSLLAIEIMRDLNEVFIVKYENKPLEWRLHLNLKRVLIRALLD